MYLRYWLTSKSMADSGTGSDDRIVTDSAIFIVVTSRIKEGG